MVCVYYILQILNQNWTIGTGKWFEK